MLLVNIFKDYVNSPLEAARANVRQLPPRIPELPGAFPFLQVVETQLRPIAAIALIELLYRQIFFLDLMPAALHIVRVFGGVGNHPRATFLDAYPELLRRRLVVR